MTSPAPLDDLLASTWMAAAFVDELEAGPMARRVAGHDLVIAHLGDDVTVLPDRCAHRGAPLSAGVVTPAPDGAVCLACPYHALHYDVAGVAHHYPGRPDARLPRRLDLEPWAVEVADGIVWTAMGQAPTDPPPDLSSHLADDRGRFTQPVESWSTPAWRLVENFSDLAHFATIHAATFGDEGTTLVPEVNIAEDERTIRQSVRQQQLARLTFGDAPVPILVTYEYIHMFPFTTELVIAHGEGRIERIQISMTPSDIDACLVFQRSTRDFDIDGDIEGWQAFQYEVNEEDRRLLERIVPRAALPDGSDVDEVALPTDEFTTVYRRRWRTRMAAG